jgi:hypothetical protein
VSPIVKAIFPAAILAGGLGTRLYPLTERLPKALIEINGEPFLAHQLRLLRTRGIERVVLCIGQHGERIREYAGDGTRFGLAIDYSPDGPALLGTAGALRNALPLLGDAFFVVYGDSYLAMQAAGTRATWSLPKAAYWHTIKRTGQRACSTSIMVWASSAARLSRAHRKPISPSYTAASCAATNWPRSKSTSGSTKSARSMESPNYRATWLDRNHDRGARTRACRVGTHADASER